MGEHTPGPWVQNSLMVSEANQPINVGRDICHCGMGMRRDPFESEANARLIAASPDLLAACEFALECLVDWDRENGEAGDMLRTAIAKAKGE